MPHLTLDALSEIHGLRATEFISADPSVSVLCPLGINKQDFDFLSSLKLALSLLIFRVISVPVPQVARRFSSWAVRGMHLLERT